MRTPVVPSPMREEKRQCKSAVVLNKLNLLNREAQHLRAEAAKLPHGAEREELVRKARRAEAGANMSGWLTSPGLRAPTQYSDAERAKRFRDKAAEALQLIDLAETQSRRSALQQIADSYNRVADQLEGVANANRGLR